ncbi:hypothetical protein BN1723_009517, partial [Verticillium longisporum]
MAPKTRSGGQPDSERVYHSSPALKQTKFPHKRTTIRGYGQRPKNLRRKIADRDSSPADIEAEIETKAKSPKQSTLTQFNWVDRGPIEDEDEPERSRGKKRRKTEGDAPNSSPPRSTFHTQTLTQAYPGLSFSSKDEDPSDLQIDDSEDENLSLVFEDANESADKPGVDQPVASPAPSVVPQTPKNKRVHREVIPSSQDSPLTPMLARYSPANKRSPLKHKSTNVMAPLPEVSETPKLPRPRTMVIEDSTVTKSPTCSSIDPSPGKENRDPLTVHTATVKAVRFVTPRPSQLVRPPQSRVLGEISIPEDEVSEENGERDASPSPLRRKSTPKPTEREIADSEDDLDELGEADLMEDEDEYGAVGHETQMLAEDLVNLSEKSSSAEASAGNLPPVQQWVTHDESDVADAGQATTAERVSEPFTSSPQLPTPRPISQVTTQSQTQTQSLDDFSQITPTQARSQPTQAMESQRISLEQIHAMGPQTDRSDIFISIHPEHVDEIIKGTKNHEFRGYRIPNVVTRMWIYVTAPISMLRYMAVISNYKQPGEIEENGLGNAEFNAGKKQNSFAYELQEVYELNNPVSLAEMKEHGWVAGPPQKYNYVPPTVVGHLMANLRCSLFGEEGEGEDQAADLPLLDDLPSELSPVKQHHKPSSPSKYTISQEVEKQILSEATLQNTSDPDLLVPSSSSQERRRVYNATPAAPSLKLPSKLPPTPFNRLPNPKPSSAARRSVRLSQATTASQASSPPASPAKTTRQRSSRAPLPSSSLSLLPLDDTDSPIQLPAGEFSLETSQLLTKSQMLPDSVLLDEDPVEDDEDVIYETD